MKYRAGQRVRILRGPFKGRRGSVKEIDRRFRSPYLVKIDGVSKPDHFQARDMEATKG